MLEFAWPWVFALAPLPLLIFWLASRRERDDIAVRVPFYHALAQVRSPQGGDGGSQWLKKSILVLIWASCVVAAARPQWVGEPVNLPASGRDLMLAMDFSGSMEIADMTIQGRSLQRVDVAKYVISDFIERRESDRIGLILFGSQAYLQAPLTFDRATVKQLLQEAQIGFAGQQTAIGDAIGLAIKRLRDRRAESRVLILLSDGANTAGEVEPRQAADLAKLAGIRIHTIGLGADEMVQQTLFGRRTVNPSADLDEGTMRYVAEQTGGRYFRARNPQELVEIYDELDKLEPVEQDDATFRPISALFYWPLAAAFILSLLLALGISAPWQRLSNRQSSSASN